MSEDVLIQLIPAIYHVCILLVGLAITFMGYRLFVTGVYEKTGELSAAWGKSNLLLKQAAPGIFFALFGTLVIGVGVWKGVETSSSGVSFNTAPIAQVYQKHIANWLGEPGNRDKLKDWLVKRHYVKDYSVANEVSWLYSAPVHQLDEAIRTLAIPADPVSKSDSSTRRVHAEQAAQADRLKDAVA